MGHLQQCKQGVRSTKIVENDTNNKDDMPNQETNNKKTHLVFIALEDIEGKFIVTKLANFPARRVKA